MDLTKIKKIIPFNKYKPVEYWQKRGVQYQNNFVHNDFFKTQEDVILNHLKTMKFSSVLEFGCGFGRITKLILDNFPIQTYNAFDLSVDQINNAKKLCINLDVKFKVSTIQEYVDQNKYDIVIGSETLMHILPSDIQTVVEKLSKFTNSDMINIDFYQDKKTVELAKHNFLHQYDTIYKNISNIKSVSKTKINEKQCLFHASFT